MMTDLNLQTGLTSEMHHNLVQGLDQYRVLKQREAALEEQLTIIKRDIKAIVMHSGRPSLIVGRYTASVTMPRENRIFNKGMVLTALLRLGMARDAADAVIAQSYKVGMIEPYLVIRFGQEAQ